MNSALLSPTLALSLEQLGKPDLSVIIGVVLAVLIVGYFGLRFWLVTTRPPAIKEVETPTLDRSNLSALNHMAEETAEEDEQELEALQNEDAPDDLKQALPPEKAVKA